MRLKLVLFIHEIKQLLLTSSKQKKQETKQATRAKSLIAWRQASKKREVNQRREKMQMEVIIAHFLLIYKQQA